ncbi:CIS tube protein [Chitinimonas taiwanensis]|uniref:CIS tube protein n=1 Tax=Chitinimonas taiwanensis TaxID=240412 RepID=UPI0035B2E70B
MELAKASLCEISADEACRHVGDPVAVQFNPTSLRVSISNKSAGGQQAGAQARQRPGTGEMQVSFDLVFDTADLGSTENPVPVTDKTVLVEKFVRPRGNTAAQQTPPRVEFAWGSFLVQGVMESANIELDLFSHNGTPLRAKVAVSIKGQDPRYQYQPSPAASGAPASQNAPGAALPADTPPGTPGTRGNRPAADESGTVAQAMPGESLQQLAARNGLDPAAWRALAASVANPLNLPAGFEVALPAALSLGGSAAGQDVAAQAAQLPLLASRSSPLNDATEPSSKPAQHSAGAASLRAGLALSAQGGAQGAMRQLQGQREQASQQTSKLGFGMAPTSAPAAQPSPRPYGAGLPLRSLYGDVDDRLPVSSDPTRPGWEALAPTPTQTSRALDRLQPRDPCRCNCGPRKA